MEVVKFNWIMVAIMLIACACCIGAFLTPLRIKPTIIKVREKESKVIVAEKTYKKGEIEAFEIFSTCLSKGMTMTVNEVVCTQKTIDNQEIIIAQCESGVRYYKKDIENFVKILNGEIK